MYRYSYLTAHGNRGHGHTGVLSIKSKVKNGKLTFSYVFCNQNDTFVKKVSRELLETKDEITFKLSDDILTYEIILTEILIEIATVSTIKNKYFWNIIHSNLVSLGGFESAFD